MAGATVDSSGSKTVIIYQSKYGSTRRYAQWIAETTGGDVFSIDDFDISRLKDYQTVIFGSYTHMGKIPSINFIERYWSILQNKTVIVFATSGTPSVGSKEKEIIEKNLPRAAKGRVTYFPLPGAYSYHQLDWKDKLLMNGPKWKMLFQWYVKKDPRAFENLKHFHTPQDWTSKEALKPLLAFLMTKSKE